jgi:SHS2 domain-containing protein
MKYKFLEHTADVKFQAFGNSIAELFENSAMALKESICGRIKVKDKIRKRFVIERPSKNLTVDYEKMLYRFLEEFLYLLDAEDFLLSGAKVGIINTTRLEVTAFGDTASDYNFTNPVKAVTYNEMFVKKKTNRWTAQVVLDV